MHVYSSFANSPVAPYPTEPEGPYLDEPSKAIVRAIRATLASYNSNWRLVYQSWPKAFVILNTANVPHEEIYRLFTGTAYRGYMLRVSGHDRQQNLIVQICIQVDLEIEDLSDALRGL